MGRVSRRSIRGSPTEGALIRRLSQSRRAEGLAPAPSAEGLAGLGLGASPTDTAAAWVVVVVAGGGGGGGGMEGVRACVSAVSRLSHAVSALNSQVRAGGVGLLCDLGCLPLGGGRGEGGNGGSYLCRTSTNPRLPLLILAVCVYATNRGGRWRGGGRGRRWHCRVLRRRAAPWGPRCAC